MTNVMAGDFATSAGAAAAPGAAPKH